MKAILLIQLRQLGDILLTTPCIKAIRSQYPRARICFLSHKMGQLILQGNPFLDVHYHYSDDSTLGQQAALIKQLRQEKFDIVCDFMANPRSALLSLLAGAKRRIAIDTRRRWFYHQTIRNDSEQYIVAEKLGVLHTIGVRSDDPALTLPWDDRDAEAMQRFFTEHPKLKQGALRVILSPTHRRHIRRWPIDRYAALGDHLAQHHGASITWLWGPGEEELACQGQQRMREPSLLAPSTSFRGMAALIANHDLFIGNSNGPSHVAVASGIYSIQLHGHTRGVSWCPNTPRHRFIQSRKFAVDPTHAMEAITLEDVLSCFDEMKAPLMAEAATRRLQPIRTNWQQD